VGVDVPRDAPAIVQTTTAWLTEQGLEGHDVSKIVPGLGQRLRQLQLQVDRVGCAIVSLHPQIMSEEIVWNAESDDAQTTLFTPAMMEVSGNRSGPYFHLALNGITYGRFPLAEQDGAPEGSLLGRLNREGYRDYFAFFHPTGSNAEVSLLSRRIGLVPCVVGSFATRRPAGFSDVELECFKAISRTFALAARAHANYKMAARLLDVYVGHSCGSRVLNGQIVRGQSDQIRCGIWYCDMRDSSRLVTALPADEYITLLNRYFDATAGAVMAAGGQVLKFIGDAVLGIFQSDEPGEDITMREQALTAVTTTLNNVSSLGVLGRQVSVGIALHVGEVMFGNVGTEDRLDFTIIGRAVNEVARLQDLTKKLKHPVLASAAFVAPIPDRFEFDGDHHVAGFSGKLAAYRLRV
jgi:adenylate cyclase